MLNIPYEAQNDPANGRLCGAACLSMVYRSFGQDAAQEEIWPAIAKVNRLGSKASTTHLMAQNAIDRGLTALVIGARHPMQALHLCNEHGLRAILNHRLESNSATGHYTVLVDFDSTSAVLHDPYFGPARRVSHNELLKLWQPDSAVSEIAGGVLIAIGERARELPPCEFCGTPVVANFSCPTCRTPIALAPSEVLGCLNDECVARVWNYVCCPVCDSLWDFKAREETSGKDAAAPEPSAHPEKLHSVSPFFEHLKKFRAHMENLPGARNHQELQQHFQTLTDSKAALTRALAESVLLGQAHAERVASFTRAAEQNRDAHRQKSAEMNAPLPPIDGNALGRALLRDLGFSGF